jgi:hypothetical protein
MKLISPIVAVAEHMRKLGWYESHLFSHAFLQNGWCVGLWPDEWTLSYATETPGIYSVKARGTTLSELQKALADAGLYQEAA